MDLIDQKSIPHSASAKRSLTDVTQQLFYAKSGQGSVVVLLHGFLASSTYWQKIITSLEKNYTVISIDLLGFGHSPKPKNIRYDLEDQVIAINETLQQIIKGATPFTLVGHSMGGLIALYYAQKYPQNVQEVVLLAPPMFQNSDEAHREIKHTHPLYRLALYTGAGRVIWPIIKLSTYIPLMGHSNAQLLSQGLRYSSHHSRTRSLTNIIEAQPLHTLLQQGTTPKSLFIGKNDRPIYQKNAQLLTDTPYLTVHFVDGGHHFIHNYPEILLKHLDNRGEKLSIVVNKVTKKR